MIRVALALVAAVGAPHSPSTCAIAWNARAGATLLTRVARSHARTAFIQDDTLVATDTWTKTSTTSTQSKGCSIVFVLPRGGSIRAWGRWRGSTVVGWTAMPAAASFRVPHNARVHADGTVGFTG
ncbi:MAG: hypothetical protein ABUS54_13410 [Actinomycetota bacterium]